MMLCCSRIIFRKRKWIELIIPGAESRIALFTPEGHETRIGGFQPVTFWCDDIFATSKILKKQGCGICADPKKEVWGTMAIIKDIDGNQFVVSSKKAKPL